LGNSVCLNNQNSGKKDHTIEQRKRTSLDTLPFDIAIKIFRKLDPVYSACTGVTCKYLYTVHRSLWPNIRLNLKAQKERRIRTENLSVYLREWMKPLVYDIAEKKFVTAERLAALRKERNRCAKCYSKRRSQWEISYSQEAWLYTYGRGRTIHRNRTMVDGILIGGNCNGAST
jgi:hypothetical protein